MYGKSYLAWALFHLFLCQSSWGSQDSAEVIDKMFANYDKRVRPFAREKPLEVSMSAYIIDVYGIDEIKHEFTVTMYLRHLWKDPRLKGAFEKSTLDAVLLDSDYAHKLWLPDTFIANLRKLESPDIYNEATKVSYDGSVIRSNRISTTASCKFDLGFFPFDIQVCSLDFESYGSTASEFFYKWKEDSLNFVQVSSDTTNPRFHVSNVLSKASTISMHGTNFSRFSMEFTLVRCSSRYVTDIYLPIAGLTIVAFMTFAMSPYAMRIQISCFLLAAMAIFVTLTMGNLPQLSQHTALDVYLIFCFLLTFLVVLTHFVLAHFGESRNGKRREAVEMSDLRQSLQTSRDTLADDQFRLGRPSCLSTLENLTSWTLSKAEIVIPILFVSFNFAYWSAIIISGVVTAAARQILDPANDLHV